MPRFRMLIEYDGRSYSGWQVQPDEPTVQEAVETAMRTALRQKVEVTGSGRTDAGVHAAGQVAHFDAGGDVEPFRLRRSLNGLLPPDIAIRALERTHDDFHARYDARRRRYHYYASTAPSALDRHMRWLLRPVPDFARMNEAAALLTGTHDFDSFCRAQSETRNRVCTVYDARWVPEPDAGSAHVTRWRFEIAADRFLHGMVRTIVGTLIEIGRGKREPAELRDVLDARDRRAAGAAAPAHGLVLQHVTYDEPFAAEAFDSASPPRAARV